MRRGIAWVGLLLFVIQSMAWTQESALGPHDRVLRIGVDYYDFPPDYFWEDGVLKGSFIEVFNYLAESQGFRVAYIPTPFARMLNDARQRRTDGVIGIYRTADREAYLHYPSEGVSYSPMHLVVAADASDLLTADNPTWGQDIGAVRGWHYGSVFDADRNTVRVDFDNDGAILRNVSAGLLRMGISNRAAFEMLAKRFNLDDHIAFLPDAATQLPIYFTFSKKPGYRELADRFDAALIAFKATPEYAEIMTRHGVTPDLWFEAAGLTDTSEGLQPGTVP